MRQAMRLAVGSVIVGLAVLAIKSLAWWVTGSVALLSDALESTVNVATATAALAAIHVAQRPADANHPYGHHKAEYFSAVFEGVMIIVAALVIMFEVYRGLQSPVKLQAPAAGLVISGAAGALNAFWSWTLITQGRRLRSPSLVADGKHLRSDVVSSVGVLLGILLAVTTGWTILDPILAALLAVNILWSGWKVVRESLSGLMDEAVPEAMLARIRSVISSEALGAVEAHDLRTRQSGRAVFIDFHLVVDGTTPVADAHDLCDRIEAALKEAVSDSVVTIHVEPPHKAKHTGIVVL